MYVLGIPLFAGSISDAMKHIIHVIDSEKGKANRLINFAGANDLVISKKNQDFRSILLQNYLHLPDGMPCVWVGKLKGNKNSERCYGPDFFLELMKNTSNYKINHYLCGGKEGIAEELKHVCTSKFHNANIVGIYSPPFREMTDEELRELSEDINSKNTDILWVGLSSPKQQILGYRLSKFTKVHFIIGVGAAFDFHTGKVKQAPKWLQRIGMEWFFRLVMEPKRLWKRYFEIVPLFIWYNIVEIITGKFFINEEKENNVTK